MAVPASPQIKHGRGPRIGWTLGCIGALLWLPVLGIVLFFLNKYVAGLTAIGFFILGVIYSRVFAPWKYPDTPIRRIYSGFAVIILLGAATIFALWYPWLTHHTTIKPQLPWYILVLICMPVKHLHPGHHLWKKNLEPYPHKTDE